MSYYGTETIEDLLTLSITDLKRLGYLVKGATCTGRVTWNRRGREVASIGVQTNTAGEIPAVRFYYNANGSPVDYSTPLRFAPSNLNRGGYYYFVCPVTGRSCRKLYLIGSRFVSRFAFRALYEKQTKSHAERAGVYGYLDAVTKLDDMIKQPRRKMYYREELTPYGRKVQKQAERVKQYGNILEREREKSRRKFTQQAAPEIADIATFWE